MNKTLKINFLDLESMCMSVLPACTYVHHMHTWCPWRPEEVVWVPRTGVRGGCECWGSNLDLLKEQQVFLITEPSLEPPDC